MDVSNEEEANAGVDQAAAAFGSIAVMPSSFACSGICFCTSGVITKPGQMTLARTLCVAPSFAIVRANPKMPYLAEGRVVKEVMLGETVDKEFTMP
jgi:hypothetical protein